jgi:hypothetical protein
MGGLLALDPTGTFFRFTKILQIVNKLYFNQHKTMVRGLEAFLADLNKDHTLPLPSQWPASPVPLEKRPRGVFCPLSMCSLVWDWVSWACTW